MRSYARRDQPKREKRIVITSFEGGKANYWSEDGWVQDQNKAALFVDFSKVLEVSSGLNRKASFQTLYFEEGHFDKKEEELKEEQEPSRDKCSSCNDREVSCQGGFRYCESCAYKIIHGEEK